MTEKFSVLMPLYRGDEPARFSLALNSVFSGTLCPDEVVLVVDGPISPGLEEVIRERTRDELVVVRHEHNKGLAAALNTGLSHITHEIVIRADSDDVNGLHRFEKLLQAMGKGYDIVGSNVEEVDESGALVAIRKTPETRPEIMRFAMRRNPFNHMSVAFRRTVVVREGGYPANYLREDYVLWIRLLANGASAYNLQENLVQAQAGTGMFERRGGLKYALGELGLQKDLCRLGFKSPLRAVYDGLMRATVFLAPPRLRAWVYHTFLREDPCA